MVDNQQEEPVVCPNCHVEGPRTMYCLNCGYPLFQHEREDSILKESKDVSTEVEADLVELESEEVETQETSTVEQEEEIDVEVPKNATEVEVVAEPTTMEETEVVEDIQEQIVGEEGALGYVPEPGIKKVMEELKKSISLQLWLVDLLQEGKVKEDHFKRMFEGYSNRTEQCMNRRNELLKRARDIEDLEKALNEARVGLGELEIRRSIGDALEEEYIAKAPSFRWDIDHFEAEISKRQVEIAFLEDITNIMTEEEISEMNNVVERISGSLEALQNSGIVSQETFTKVKNSLEETMENLKELKCIS